MTPPELPELRRQDLKNRQNSIDDLDSTLVQLYEYEIAKLYDDSYRLYYNLLESGIAKECARVVLPLATPSRLYMNGTVRSWLHYCDLRCSNGTQKEHAVIAGQVKNLLYEHLPNVCEAMWNRKD